MGAGKGKSRRAQVGVLRRALLSSPVQRAKHKMSWSSEIKDTVEAAAGSEHRQLFYRSQGYGIMATPELLQSLLEGDEGVEKFNAALRGVRREAGVGRVTIHGLTVRDSDLKGLDLSNMELMDVVIKDCDLSGASFKDTNLQWRNELLNVLVDDVDWNGTNYGNRGDHGSNYSSNRNVLQVVGHPEQTITDSLLE